MLSFAFYVCSTEFCCLLYICVPAWKVFRHPCGYSICCSFSSRSLLCLLWRWAKVCHFKAPKGDGTYSTGIMDITIYVALERPMVASSPLFCISFQDRCGPPGGNSVKVRGKNKFILQFISEYFSSSLYISLLYALQRRIL